MLDRLEAALPGLTPADRPPFGLGWVGRYLPHYLTCPPSRLHTDLAADLRAMRAARGQRRCYVAPRGPGRPPG
jgi:hypothetical protein